MKIFLLRSLNRIVWCYAYLGLIYALYFIYFIVVPTYDISNSKYLFFNIIFFYFFLQAYFNLICTKFSSISLDTKSIEYCQLCSNYRPERSHHCYVCQRCIPDHDHHCFFLGTCIGKHNLKYFLLFLFHLIIAHLIGYTFVSNYLWSEVGGFRFVTIWKILFFNIGYLTGYVETKWQAFICFHHYLVYFNIVFMSKLFYQVLKRSLNGQTQYEEKKKIQKNKQTFSQIFGTNKWNLIFPFIHS